MPDVDVDGDGLEAFCDTDFLDNINTVDMCIDGDGTVIMDEAGINCTEYRLPSGEFAFTDGISVTFNFEAVPALRQ